MAHSVAMQSVERVDESFLSKDAKNKINFSSQTGYATAPCDNVNAICTLKKLHDRAILAKDGYKEISHSNFRFENNHHDNKLQTYSDNDSGCALEEYSWIPPGIRPDQVSSFLFNLVFIV